MASAYTQIPTAKIVELRASGLFPAQIAKELGTSRGFINSRLSRAGKAGIPNAELYGDRYDGQIAQGFNDGLSHRKIAKKLQIAFGIGISPAAVRGRLKKLGLHRELELVTLAELGECRMDPAWEARQDMKALAAGLTPRFEKKVVCRECGRLVAEINANGEHSHLRTHCMEPDDYARKYFGARFCNFARTTNQSNRQRRPTNVREVMEKFANEWLTPNELAEHQKDPQYEKRHGFLEYAACRLCGFKCTSSLYTHLRDGHDLTIRKYHNEYTYAPIHPLKVKNERIKPYAKEFWEAKKQKAAADQENLSNAERRVADLKEELRQQEAIVAELKGKLGRPKSRANNLQKFGPRLSKLLAARKSIGSIVIIMNNEIGRNKSRGFWRHLIDLLPPTETKSSI